MIQADKILIKPIVSEKAALAAATHNQYTFKVHSEANAVAVAQAVEYAFKEKKVEVVKVNIINVKPKFKRSRTQRGKMSRKSGYKKALVTLKPGQTIDLI